MLKLGNTDQSCSSVLFNMLQQEKQPLVCSSIGPKCRFTLDNKCPSLENGTADEIQGISESGWTMYLDQSLDECSYSYYNSRSLIRFEEYVGRNNGNGPNQPANFEEEDSSMVSDASSGPQQLLDVDQFNELQNGADKLLSSDDQIYLKNLTSFDVAEIRQSKRRRLESDTAVEKDLYLLEDTASSPVCSSKSGLTENEGDAKDYLHLSNAFSGSLDQADAVNKRLDLLQSMLPETPICKQETLGVAMEYISAMEQRIKAYEGKDNGKGSNSNKAFPAENFDGECGVLRKRGLCLVPISTLRSGV